MGGGVQRWVKDDRSRRRQKRAGGKRGRLKLISRPPQLSTVFGELKHACILLSWGGQVIFLSSV